VLQKPGFDALDVPNSLKDMFFESDGSLNKEKYSTYMIGLEKETARLNPDGKTFYILQFQSRECVDFWDREYIQIDQFLGLFATLEEAREMLTKDLHSQLADLKLSRSGAELENEQIWDHPNWKGDENLCYEQDNNISGTDRPITFYHWIYEFSTEKRIDFAVLPTAAAADVFSYFYTRGRSTVSGALPDKVRRRGFDGLPLKYC
jgi:hypothetical protein